MTDTPPIAAAPKAAPSTDGQVRVALSIVAAITVTMIALTIAGVLTKQWVLVAGLIGTGLGSLATALNAPTGISNALSAAKKDPAA